MDGVLVDSEPLWFQAEAMVMSRLGGGWGEGDQHALLGGSMDVTVAYLLERGTRPAAPTSATSSRAPGMTGSGPLVAEVGAAGLVPRSSR